MDQWPRWAGVARPARPRAFRAEDKTRMCGRLHRPVKRVFLPTTNANGCTPISKRRAATGTWIFCFAPFDPVVQLHLRGTPLLELAGYDLALAPLARYLQMVRSVYHDLDEVGSRWRLSSSDDCVVQFLDRCSSSWYYCPHLVSTLPSRVLMR